MPTTVVGSMQGGELDAAPGGIAWIDDGLSLHVRTALSRPGHTLRASRSTQFKHLDVGLDPHGRTVATVAECRSGHPCAWLSVPVSTGRRSALPVTAPPDCRVVSVARWRTRTAMGVSCRTPRSTNVVVAQDGRLQRLAFDDYSNGVRAAPVVDLRDNLLIADLHGDGYDDIWAMRLGRHPCRRLLDVADSEGDTWMDAAMARITPKGQVLWAFQNSYFDAGSTWGNVDTVRADCKTSERYVLPDGFPDMMTIVGTKLVRENQGMLTSEQLITVPPPLWAIDNPFGD
jgi:hypothetical protein